jgi:four helix bundle protein
MFSLASQIKRAGDSVVLNIAAGSTGQTKAEFARVFLLHYVLQ